MQNNFFKNISEAIGSYGDEPDENQAEKNPENLLNNIQRSYVLKQTYVKLLSLYNEFSNFFPIGVENIDNKKEEIKDTINYMEFFMNNLKAYEGKIDEIIELFQKFLHDALDFFRVEIKKINRGQ